MARLHGSFVVRWWLLDRGGSRIELEHIQSGARTVTGSLADALAWIGGTFEGQPARFDAADTEAEEPGERGGTSDAGAGGRHGGDDPSE